jgi:hypothetical protein
MKLFKVAGNYVNKHNALLFTEQEVFELFGISDDEIELTFGEGTRIRVMLLNRGVYYFDGLRVIRFYNAIYPLLVAQGVQKNEVTPIYFKVISC